jgi:hypothetical protein
VMLRCLKTWAGTVASSGSFFRIWMTMNRVRKMAGEDNEEDDDARVRPRVGGAAPLEGEEETDDAGEEADCGKGVELCQLSFESCACFCWWCCCEKED